MPRRTAPSQEETPFVPTEPWWRRPRPGQKSGRAIPFQAVAPRPAERLTTAVTTSHIRINVALLAIIFVVAALGGGIGFAVTTDWLAVLPTSTEIRGAQRIAADAIYAASQLDGVNIFQVHPGRAAAGIKQLPGIAEATVQPRLPYYVIITVREEVPFVVWQGITTTTWLAANGATVAISGEPPALRLHDPAGAAADPSGRLDPAVLADLKALHMAGLETTELYFGAREGLYFRSADGWTVYLGRGGQMAAKLSALREIKKSDIAATARARIIDLRFPGRAQVW